MSLTRPPATPTRYSEEIVGQAVQGYRDGVFVIDKIDHLDQPVAPQIEASLKRLQLDATDLFVFHNVSTLSRLGQTSPHPAVG